MMQPDKGSRVDIVELKALMLKKIGLERFKRYFYLLNRFINQKMSKVDFDRSCLRVLGKENLPLHNQIIKAILKNACSAKAPPQVNQVGPTSSAMAAARSSTILDNGLRAGFVVHNQIPSMPIQANGIALPISPRKARSGIRDRKLRDRPSPLGPNGKTDSASHQSTATEDSGAKTIDNGDLGPCDYQRPLQQLQGLAEQSEFDERVRSKRSSDIPVAILSKDHSNAAVVEDGEEVEQASHLNLHKSPLVAPLGIPLCPASVGGARKSIPVASTCNYVSSVDGGVLPDSEMLRQRMEQIAASFSLAGATLECANSLNNMLDVYMKRLVKSCVNLVGEKSASDSMKGSAQRQQMHSKLMNGLWPSNHAHMESVTGTNGGHRDTHSISVHDFKAAMQLKPQQLGEDWPLLMEKISMEAFEE